MGIPVRAIGLAIAASLLIVATAVNGQFRSDDGPQPSPGLGPSEVVRIQLQALANNAELADDNGIRIAYRFASPSNRAAVGPIENFIRLMKSPGYRDMLDHRDVQFGELSVDGKLARQPITLTTFEYQQMDYVFFLSRYQLPDCSGCWMTDAVESLSPLTSPARPTAAAVRQTLINSSRPRCRLTGVRARHEAQRRA